MVKWKCVLCDYVYDGNWPPDRCSISGTPREKFVKVIEED